MVTHVYVPTECGLEFLKYEGHWYRTKSPIKNLPDGWSTPTQDGDVRLVSKNNKHVRFEPYGITDSYDFYRTAQRPAPC